MKIGIGSTNPTKIAAVKRVFSNGDEFVIIDAPSNVSEQPIGDDETMEGAINRAKACLALDPSVAIAIGLEGGIAENSFGLMVINWGALVDRDGNVFVASGIRGVLPPEVAMYIKEGWTLGEAIDRFTKRKGVSKKEGAMGVITNGRIPRDDMFAHVVKALLGQYEFYNVR